MCDRDYQRGHTTASVVELPPLSQENNAVTIGPRDLLNMLTKALHLHSFEGILGDKGERMQAEACQRVLIFDVPYLVCLCNTHCM